MKSEMEKFLMMSQTGLRGLTRLKKCLNWLCCCSLCCCCVYPQWGCCCCCCCRVRPYLGVSLQPAASVPGRLWTDFLILLEWLTWLMRFHSHTKYPHSQTSYLPLSFYSKSCCFQCQTYGKTRQILDLLKRLCNDCLWYGACEIDSFRYNNLEIS